MDKKKLFEKWSQKLTISVDELEKEFKEKFESDKKIHTTLTNDEREKHILQIMQAMYKRQFMSPAKVFEGYFIGFSNPVDVVRKIRATAIEIWNQDKSKAIQEGFTDEEGNPIFKLDESSPAYSWKNGKPIPKFDYIRSLFVIAKERDLKDEPKLMSMVVRGDLVSEIPPLFKKIEFRATYNKDQTMLNGSSVTQFKVIDDKEIDFKKVILEKYLDSRLVELSQLREWISTHKDMNDFCVASGTVARISITTSSNNAAVLNLDDLSLGFEEDKNLSGVTVWVPSGTDINFGEQSTIYVIGRPSEAEDGRLNINAYGIWADPEFSTSPDVPPEKISQAKLPETSVKKGKTEVKVEKEKEW